MNLVYLIPIASYLIKCPFDKTLFWAYSTFSAEYLSTPYIYNTTTVDQKCCRVDYRLENQGAMQHMMVNQMPRQYKMSLADLEALQ